MLPGPELQAFVQYHPSSATLRSVQYRYTVVQLEWPTGGRRISRNPPASSFLHGWRWKEEFTAWGNFLVEFGSMEMEMQTMTVTTDARMIAGAGERHLSIALTGW